MPERIQRKRTKGWGVIDGEAGYCQGAGATWYCPPNLPEELSCAHGGG